MVRSFENMLPHVLGETYLCISIPEDTGETPKQWFKRATQVASECWLEQRAVSATQMYLGWGKNDPAIVGGN